MELQFELHTGNRSPQFGRTLGCKGSLRSSSEIHLVAGVHNPQTSHGRIVLAYAKQPLDVPSLSVHRTVLKLNVATRSRPRQEPL
ncbi:hypothetical protein GE061_012519 [Apolygus lucorum]|uniref:Uncharacterized protein n=1 Tax=Apolygus lucorum TaxID=248454 RepID=A0A8S9XUL6_APOLU|nr:hypothetical protein GE061_012519 [Apolygus lucorum]